MEPEILDALDKQATVEAVMRARPDAIVHQLTAIPPNLNLRRFDSEFALTNRLRTEGTDNLLAAARAAGVRRFVAQSFAGWTYERAGGPVKTEEDPLDPDPPPAFRRTLDAIRYLEAALQAAEHIETTDAALRLVLRSSNISRPRQRAPRCDSSAATADCRQRRWDLVFHTHS